MGCEGWIFGRGHEDGDALDESILYVDISVKRLVIVDHAASFDQQFFTLEKERERLHQLSFLGYMDFSAALKNN